MINMKSLNKIIMAYKSDSDILFMINDTLNSMKDYVSIIAEEDVLISTKKWTLSKEELQYEITHLDKKRRALHNEVIHGVAFINRICKMKDFELFYNGDIEDRRVVGETAFSYVEYTFKNRYNR